MSAEIVSSSDTMGGKHRIEGTRIRVIDVVKSYQELGWDIEEIAEEYDLTPQQVLEALKFYYDNKKEVRQEFLDRKKINA